MKIGILFAAFLSFSGTSAFASSWNKFYTDTNDASYYFDSESVNKTKDVVTLWVKTVQKNLPDEDGSWSTAFNWGINCQKRTIQLLSWSSYDSTGKFIKSNSNSTSETSIRPDSVGAGVQKAVCITDFPRNTLTTKESYFRVESNDIFAFTKLLVEYEKSKVDNAPK